MFVVLALVNMFVVFALAAGVGYKYGIAAGVCAVPGITCLCLIYAFWSFGRGNRKLKEPNSVN